MISKENGWFVQVQGIHVFIEKFQKRLPHFMITFSETPSLWKSRYITIDFLPRFLIIKSVRVTAPARTDKYRHAYSTRYTIKNLGADTSVNESKMIVRGISDTSSAFRRKVNTSLSVELIISQAGQLKSVNCEALSCNSYFFRIFAHLSYCVGFN